MSTNIQNLIDRIKTEGVEAARKKSQDIEQAAESQAKDIIRTAKREAEVLLADAKMEIKKREESSRTALKQAARDTLITLRKDIQNTLKQVASLQVGEALSPERLCHLIEKVIVETLKQGGETPAVHVILSPEDLQALKDTLINRLQESLKSSLDLRSSDHVGGGLMIGFDRNTVSFDFTDTALAEYLSQYVNEHVANALKEASH